MKFDRSNKFDFCYYGRVKSLQLKSRVASKWASKNTFGGIIYFAGDSTMAIGGNRVVGVQLQWRVITR